MPSGISLRSLGLALPFPSDENASGHQKTFKNRLARYVAAGQGAVFPYLRSPLDVRHPAQRRRRGGRVGHAVAPSGPCQVVHEVFANEVAIETRGAGETQPAS